MRRHFLEQVDTVMNDESHRCCVAYAAAAWNWTRHVIPRIFVLVVAQPGVLASEAVTVKWVHQTPLLLRERKCADTTSTVPVPWAGHFQC